MIIQFQDSVSDVLREDRVRGTNRKLFSFDFQRIEIPTSLTAVSEIAALI